MNRVRLRRFSSSTLNIVEPEETAEERDSMVERRNNSKEVVMVVKMGQIGDDGTCRRSFK